MKIYVSMDLLSISKIEMEQPFYQSSIETGTLSVLMPQLLGESQAMSLDFLYSNGRKGGNFSLQLEPDTLIENEIEYYVYSIRLSEAQLYIAGDTQVTINVKTIKVDESTNTSSVIAKRVLGIVNCKIVKTASYGMTLEYESIEQVAADLANAMNKIDGILDRTASVESAVADIKANAQNINDKIEIIEGSIEDISDSIDTVEENVKGIKNAQDLYKTIFESNNVKTNIITSNKSSASSTYDSYVILKENEVVVGVDADTGSSDGTTETGVRVRGYNPEIDKDLYEPSGFIEVKGRTYFHNNVTVQDLEDIHDELGNTPAKAKDVFNQEEVRELISDAILDANSYVEDYSYSKDEIQQLLQSVSSISIKKVDTLPAEGEANIIYLVPKATREAQDTYDEYVYIDNHWESIGSTTITDIGNVKYDSVMYLSEDEKQQARENIGAVSENDAKQYIDASIVNAKAEIVTTAYTAAKNYADGKHNELKGYTDGKISAINDTIDGIEEKVDAIKQLPDAEYLEQNCSDQVCETAHGNEVYDGEAKIVKFAGQSKASVNILKIADKSSTTTSGITYSIKDGVITFSGTATGNVNITLASAITLSAGSYYYNGFNESATKPKVSLYNGNTWVADIVVQGYSNNAYNISSNVTFNTIRLGVSGITYSNYKLYPMLVKGSVAPSVFEPHFDGVKSSQIVGIKSVGRNLFDFAKNYQITNAYSVQVSSSTNKLDTSFASGEWIRIDGTLKGLTPNQQYTISCYVNKNGGSHSAGLRHSDNTGENSILNGTQNGISSFTFVPTDTTYYLEFYLSYGSSNAGHITFENITLNKGNTALPYEPYQREINNFGLELKQYDYWENGKLYRKTGSVDLGSLNWETTNYGYRIQFPQAKPSSSGLTIPNIICDNYNPTQADYVTTTTEAIGITTSSLLFIHTTKGRPSGTLHYELATTEVVDLPIPSTLKVWNKGLIEQLVADGGLPAIRTTKYPLNISSQVMLNSQRDEEQQREIDKLKHQSASGIYRYTLNWDDDPTTTEIWCTIYSSVNLEDEILGLGDTKAQISLVLKKALPNYQTVMCTGIYKGKMVLNISGSASGGQLLMYVGTDGTMKNVDLTTDSDINYCYCEVEAV